MEERTPKDRALQYLSQLNLEPWEDVRYNMEYLVVLHVEKMVIDQ